MALVPRHASALVRRRQTVVDLDIDLDIIDSLDRIPVAPVGEP